MSIRILNGDCREVLKTLPDASVDSIVTDPPYDLTSGKKGGTGDASMNPNSPAGRSRIGTGGGFMGLKWDGTGKAAELEGFSFIGVELNPDYIEIARRRIGADAPLLREVT